MSQHFSRLILALSFASAPSLALAQFIPLNDLPAVPENTIPASIQSIPASETGVPFTSVQDQAQYVTGFDTPPEGGSETVANFLKKLEPSVDTRIPESPTQAAQRINGLITAGHFDSALKEISKLKRSDGHIGSPSTDVQLMFLEARALAGKGERAKALEIYRTMAYHYPELPEPWNNMAVLQMQAGLPEQALESVKMALSIRPNYGIANKNLALIYSQLAEQSLNQARRQGVR